MRRPFSRTRIIAHSRYASLHRMGHVEFLESRHCCSVDESLASFAIEPVFDTKDFSADVQVVQETLEQPLVYDEWINTLEIDPAMDKGPHLVFDELYPEPAVDVCSESSPEEATETLGESDEVDADSVERGTVESELDAESISNKAREACSISIETPPNWDSLDFETHTKANTNRSDTIDRPLSLAAPAVSSFAIMHSDLRPQLQPIEQLTVGRLSMSNPNSVQSVPFINVDMGSSISPGSAFNTARPLDGTYNSLQSPSPYAEERSLIQPVVSILSAFGPRSSIKRVERLAQNIRPQVAPIPLLMPRDIGIIVQSANELTLDFGSDAEGSKVRVVEGSMWVPSIKVINKPRIETSNEIGGLRPTESDKPVSKRSHLILGVFAVGLVIRWRFTAFGRRETTNRKGAVPRLEA